MTNSISIRAAICAITILTIPVLANAGLRIMPNDANYQGNGVIKEYDRVRSQLNNYDEGFIAGGTQDLYIQSPVGEPSTIEAFACPTIRTCVKTESKEACLADASFWDCKKIYSGGDAALCKEFQTAEREHELSVFLDFTILGAPFMSFTAVSIAIKAVKVGELAWNMHKASCADDGVQSDMTTLSNTLGTQDTILMTEQPGKRDQVSNAINLIGRHVSDWSEPVQFNLNDRAGNGAVAYEQTAPGKRYYTPVHATCDALEQCTEDPPPAPPF